MPIQADLQAFACHNEYHDDDHSVMPTQDARSNEYALGTPSSEERMQQTKVGSRNRWSFPLLIISIDNGNTIVKLH